MEFSHGDKLRLLEAVDRMIDYIYYEKLNDRNPDIRNHYEYELKQFQDLKKRLDKATN